MITWFSILKRKPICQVVPPEIWLNFRLKFLKAEILPFKSSFNTWGDEIYFSIPVEAELDDSTKEEVEIGDIGYWPGVILKKCVFPAEEKNSKWKRNSPEDFINLAHALTLSSRFIEAAKRAIKELGLPISEGCLEEILSKLQQEFRALNNSPLSADWFSLTLDAKETSVFIH